MADDRSFSDIAVITATSGPTTTFIMDDVPDNAGAQNRASPSKSGQPQGQSQPKRNNNRQKKNHAKSVPHIDGAVSDSVTNSMATAKSKKIPKQRQQSVAIGALPNGNVHHNKLNNGKPRPVSMGGPMLPSTPAKEQAYAGPTFQASPAASSLPVPKFFSRSVPNVAAQQKSLASRMAGEQTPEAEKSSPEPDVVAPARDAQMSPLDMFFKADAAEREKSRSASLQSPELGRRQAPPATEPWNPFAQNGKSIFLREMDGDEMPSPRTVPHNIRPAPPHRTSSTGAQPTSPQTSRDDLTKSLKDLLFNVDVSPPSNTPPNSRSRPTSQSNNNANPFHTPPPFQRSTSGPSTPTPTAEQQKNYSLHYGNRNLSPLFKAAQNSTPPPSRPSGLRHHQVANDLSPSVGHQQQPPPQIDPDSFSRSYLDQQIRASQPAAMPPLPLANGTNHSSNHSGSSALQQGVTANGNGPQASPRTASGAQERDKRTMEDDLKRMLKINVLSN